jgi:hypothetical protein
MAVGADGLDLAAASERERPRIGRVGEEVVLGAEVGRFPANLALPDGAARQPLPLADQFSDDLASRAAAIPQLIDPADRSADLLV